MFTHSMHTSRFFDDNQKTDRRNEITISGYSDSDANVSGVRGFNASLIVGGNYIQGSWAAGYTAYVPDRGNYSPEIDIWMSRSDYLTNINTWVKPDSPHGHTWKTMYWNRSGKYFIAYDLVAGQIYKSTDGFNWTLKHNVSNVSLKTDDVYGCAFKSGNEGMIARYEYDAGAHTLNIRTLHTTNFGETWTEYPSSYTGANISGHHGGITDRAIVATSSHYGVSYSVYPTQEIRMLWTTGGASGWFAAGPWTDARTGFSYAKFENSPLLRCNNRFVLTTQLGDLLVSNSSNPGGGWSAQITAASDPDGIPPYTHSGCDVSTSNETDSVIFKGAYANNITKHNIVTNTSVAQQGSQYIKSVACSGEQKGA